MIIPWPPRRLGRLILGLLFLAGLFGGWIFGEAILSGAGQWLDIGQPPVRTDYVLVLPGDSNTRPYVAAALLKAGYAGQVILLKCQATPDDLVSGYPPSHEVEERVLLSRGLSRDQVRVLDTTTASTFSDAQALKAFLTKQTGSSATVVTNDYHTRRARFAFRTVFANELSKVRFVSAPTDRFGAEDWRRHKKGLNAYLGEYLKLIFYSFRYGRGGAWAALAAVLAGVLIAVRKLHRLRYSTATRQNGLESEERS